MLKLETNDQRPTTNDRRRAYEVRRTLYIVDISLSKEFVVGRWQAVDFTYRTSHIAQHEKSTKDPVAQKRVSKWVGNKSKSKRE